MTQKTVGAAVEAPRFRLENRDEVMKFEKMLDAYAATRAMIPVNHISLTSVFDYCQTRADGGKLFTAFLDFIINFMLLWCDTNDSGRAWTRALGGEQLSGGSVLESQERFDSKMDVHRFNSSFVLRYRALWDKLMGLMVLTYAPHNYEKFVTAKSRKRAFRNCMSEVVGLKSEVHDAWEKHLTDFDEKFRTPEIHGTGALRKWSFLMVPLQETPAAELLGAWNYLNQVVSILGKGFSAASAKRQARP